MRQRRRRLSLLPHSITEADCERAFITTHIPSYDPCGNGKAFNVVRVAVIDPPQQGRPNREDLCSTATTFCDVGIRIRERFPHCETEAVTGDVARITIRFRFTQLAAGPVFTTLRLLSCHYPGSTDRT